MKTESEKIQQRYNRLAPFFDGLQAVLEGLFFKRWRRQLWTHVEGEHILEVGVGTGKNFDFYPAQTSVTAIDFSPAMLKEAHQKAALKNIAVTLQQMDLESLCYGDNCFDTVIGSFVFCSVPHPHRGLRELLRVCKPGGKVILLEHVISSHAPLAGLMKLLNPLVVNTMGANIHRQTLKNVQACGFSKVYVDTMSMDMVKLIVAVK